MSTFDVTLHAQQGQPKGANAFSFSSARVVTKFDDEGMEHTAYLIGMLLGLPVAPGFSDDDGRWHSVFIPGLVTFRDRFGEESGYGRSYTLDVEQVEPWFREGDHSLLMHRLRVFDEIIGNADRHTGNLAVGPNDELVVYDHDLVFDGLSTFGVHGDLADMYDGATLDAERRRAAEILTPSVLRSVCRYEGWADYVLARLP